MFQPPTPSKMPTGSKGLINHISNNYNIQHKKENENNLRKSRDSTIQNQVELSNHDITSAFEVDNSSTSISVASTNESIDSFT